MLINKVVIPIAGLGTRFLPATKVIPKEMLPINGKPILQILIEEAREAGIKEIILVVNHEKISLIRDYFKINTPTSKKIEEKGKSHHLKDLNTLIKSVKISYVFQDKPLGDGDAILKAAHLIKNEPFAVMFGDDIVVPHALKDLVKTFSKKKSSIIALEKIPLSKVSNYGIVRHERSECPLSPSPSPQPIEISNLVEKPSPKKAPSTLGIIGKYIVTNEIIDELKTIKKSKNKEIRLIDGFKKLLKKQKIFGLIIKGKRYDTGTIDGYKKAILESDTTPAVAGGSVP